MIASTLGTKMLMYSWCCGLNFKIEIYIVNRYCVSVVKTWKELKKKFALENASLLNMISFRSEYPI